MRLRMTLSAYKRCRLANSSGDIFASRRATARKRSIGVLARSALTADSTAALSADSVALRRAILPRQLRIGKPPSGNGRCHLAEPNAIVVFALIEPERLLIEIPAKVEGLNRDVGTFDGALQEGPEVFDAIRMGFAAHIFDGMVYDIVLVFPGQSSIGGPCVSVERGSGFDGIANLRLQRGAAHVFDNLSRDFANPFRAFPPQDTHNSRFPRAAGADVFLLLSVHVLSEATDEGFIGL